jgi:hypothetical protein
MMSARMPMGSQKPFLDQVTTDENVLRAVMCWRTRGTFRRRIHNACVPAAMPQDVDSVFDCLRTLIFALL